MMCYQHIKTEKKKKISKNIERAWEIEKHYLGINCRLYHNTNAFENTAGYLTPIRDDLCSTTIMAMAIKTSYHSATDDTFMYV